jgi:hypothetical protein
MQNRQGVTMNLNPDAVKACGYAAASILAAFDDYLTEKQAGLVNYAPFVEYVAQRSEAPRSSVYGSTSNYLRALAGAGFVQRVARGVYARV